MAKNKKLSSLASLSKAIDDFARHKRTEESKLVVASFHKKGKLTEVYRIKGRWTVFVDNRLTQRDLSDEEIVRYLCNAAEDGSEP